MSVIKGISYPFRVGVHGGVATSTATPYDTRHINEGIEQLLRTKPFERTMEFHIKSNIESTLFENVNASVIGIIKMQVVEALENDERITVKEGDVSVTRDTETGIIYVGIIYYVKEFNAYYSTQVNMGGSDNID